MRVVVAAALSTAFLTTAAAGAQASGLVLGAMGHGNGLAWGPAHPRVILDSGDEPTGKVFDLVWSDWGLASATARGLAWIILKRSNGSTYVKPGAILLRAYRLRQCRAGGPLAYTRLKARLAIRPGGPMAAWFRWGPADGNICYRP